MKRSLPLPPRSSLLHGSLAALGALAAMLGCGETTTTPRNQLTFDRPVDVAFACYGSLKLSSDGSTVESAMPTRACEERSKPRLNKDNEATHVWPGQEDVSNNAVNWYGLVLESGPGTVNIVEFDIQFPVSAFQGRVVDSDPLTPGVNGISVGEEPVAIATDPAGCHAITANAGSCDLSVIDFNSALDQARGARVDRLAVKNAAGAPILARPAAMAGLPSSSDVGNSCPAAPTGLVYVAYPGCHLVAGVDPSTGTIVTGVQYDALGVPSIVTGNVTCPAECGGGGAITPGVRPVALDLELDPRQGTRRLVIGADNSASIAVVELDDAFRPLSLFQVALENPTGKLGVTALALSPQIGMGGGTLGGSYPDPLNDESGDTFQFVYAVATDNTVRVADVLRLGRECDTQIDPRFARNVADLSALSCFPIGDPATPRRAGARGPGIRLPGTAIPLSVEILQVPELPLPMEAAAGTNPDVPEFRNPDAPGTLIGYFAAVTSSNGSTYIVNVDDDDYPDLFDRNAPLSVWPELAMAHQLRDARGQRSVTIDDQDQPFDPDPNTATNPPETDHSEDDKSCDYSGAFEGTFAIGGPRASTTPERKVPADTVAASKLTQLPGFRQVLCDRTARHSGGGKPDPNPDAADRKAITELSYAASGTYAPDRLPGPLRVAAFQDLQALPDAETWSLVWEGSLSLNPGDGSVNGPAIREGMLTVDSYGMHVHDAAESFCDTGVEPFDILQLRGCDPAIGSGDCPTGYTCFVHPESKISGLGSCMLTSEADRLADACKDFLTSVRRYTVRTTKTGELLAVPRRHVLRTTPLDGCVSDDQCELLADYADLSRTSIVAPSTTPPATCGDAARRCDPGETHTNCPSDCAARWSCVIDGRRAPIANNGKRCELRCDTSADCVTGTVCQGAIEGQSRSGFCMEGVVPPQACINASERYALHAGDAFAVIGSRTGFVHSIIADPTVANPTASNPTRECVRDPMANRLSTGRLPLIPRDAMGAPLACDPTADPLTGQLPGGGFEPNPCLTTVPHVDALPEYKPGTCEVASTTSLLVERQAPAVKFRNRQMSFSLVDPYYPGDLTCITDRQGNLGQIPHVVPGYTLTFRQVGGFAAMQVLGGLAAEDRPSFPVKAVRGPANTLWVVDEGDFLSTSASAASTRGKVLRLDPLVIGGGVTLK